MILQLLWLCDIHTILFISGATYLQNNVVQTEDVDLVHIKLIHDTSEKHSNNTIAQGKFQSTHNASVNGNSTRMMKQSNKLNMLKK